MINASPQAAARPGNTRIVNDKSAIGVNIGTATAVAGISLIVFVVSALSWTSIEPTLFSGLHCKEL